jgi:hypothetical protein
MERFLTMARGRLGSSLARWALLGLALGASPAGAALVEIPASYFVQGAGELTVSGPDCCGSTVFDGVFEARFEVDGAGNLLLTSLATELYDRDVPGLGFLGLGTLELRCAGATVTAPAAGWVAADGTISLPAGALAIGGTNFKDRDGDGRCHVVDFGLATSNVGLASGIHDPWGNHFELTSRYFAEDHTLTIRLRGSYRNRPPLARLGLVNPGFEQGGCPAVPESGNPPRWLVEANTLGGFKAGVRSFSSDPDGFFSRTDLLSDLWYHERGSGPAEVIGGGLDLGQRFFELGPVHRVSLISTDRLGAGDLDDCTFEVVDRTPPVVTPPAPLAVRCSELWGASVATSPELAAFLGAGSASDIAQPSTTALTPRAWGVDVGPSTVLYDDLWVGGPSPVEFRFTDGVGNEGSAFSTVSIFDDQAPNAWASLAPKEAPASEGSFVPVTATAGGHDTCSPVWTWLESIVSNAPEHDATDIVDAAFGDDDRSFLLRARPAAPGVPRVYAVTYRAIDYRGNSSTATAFFTVLVK